MTLPFDPKSIGDTMKQLAKGGIAGIVILGYFLLRLDYKELKETSRADYRELKIENLQLRSQMHELESSVIKENTQVLMEVKYKLANK
jgi:nitrogen regulatory protein PII-like uncharacterized protein